MTNPMVQALLLLILAVAIPDGGLKSLTNLGIPGIFIANDKNPEISQQVFSGNYILVFGLPLWFVKSVKLCELLRFITFPHLSALQEYWP